MIYKCPNCGSTKLKKDGSRLVCQVCGESYLEEELSNHLQESDKFVQNAEKELQRLLSPVSDEQIDTRLAQIEQSLSLFKGEEETKLEKFKQLLFEKFDYIDKRLEEALKAKAAPIEKEIRENKITLQEIFDRSDDLEGLSIAAFLIRNNVEKYLKTKVPMHGVDFALERNEFNDKIVNYTYVDRFTKETKKPFEDVLKYPRTIKDSYVTLKPVERFVIAGLDYFKAMNAGNVWGKTNQYIHSNEDFVKTFDKMPFENVKNELINNYNTLFKYGLVDLTDKLIEKRNEVK